MSDQSSVLVFVGREVPAVVSNAGSAAGATVTLWMSGDDFPHYHIVPDIVVMDCGGGVGPAASWNLRACRVRCPESWIVAWKTWDDAAGARLITECGVDDYLRRDIAPVAAHARLEALVRRCRRRSHPWVERFGEVVWDKQAHALRVRGVPVLLTAREEALLTVLAAEAGRTVHHDLLRRSVWESIGIDPESNVVAVTINRLRGKLRNSGDMRIDSVRGIGYRLVLRGTQRVLTQASDT